MRNETYYSRNGNRIGHWWDKGINDARAYGTPRYGLRFTLKGRVRDTQREASARTIGDARQRCREFCNPAGQS